MLYAVLGIILVYRYVAVYVAFAFLIALYV
ncbi:hypothetical protein VTH06DRAFT_8820 [Thermothelomyces fergusii]